MNIITICCSIAYSPKCATVSFLVFVRSLDCCSFIPMMNWKITYKGYCWIVLISYLQRYTAFSLQPSDLHCALSSYENENVFYGTLCVLQALQKKTYSVKRCLRAVKYGCPGRQCIIYNVPVNTIVWDIYILHYGSASVGSF